MKRTRGDKKKKRRRKISVQSAKAKGRRLQKWVCQKLTEITGIVHGKDCLIESREMGQSGVDVKLYGVAREKFPFAVECKNQEAWDVPGFIRQAKQNKCKELPNWLLFLSKNNYKPIVVMDAAAFFDLYDSYLRLWLGINHKEKHNE